VPNFKPKILIVRFSSIGDIVLTTPVIRCLKQQLGAEIHYLTKKPFRGILDANPYVDKVFAIQSKVDEEIKELQEEKYHFIVDLHHNLRSLQLKLALGRHSAAFNKLNFQKWLMVNFKINRLPDVHIVDRYLQTVAKLGVTNDGQGLDYFIPPEQEVNLGDICQWQEERRHLRPLVTSGQYIAVVIGAAHPTKRLPAEKIISICKKITLPILLLGGPGDAETGELIAAAAGIHVINTCGRFSLHQSASLVRQAKTVITHDTGLMHIAAALKKSIISIWGNTIPEFGMYPYYPAGVNENISIQVSGLSCRPCSKIGFQTCPKGHFRCMNNIDEAAVIQALKLPVLNETKA
jgi:ADP-heptose:LPS heptosyltransferase